MRSPISIVFGVVLSFGIPSTSSCLTSCSAQDLAFFSDGNVLDFSNKRLEGAMNAGFVTKGDSLKNLYRRAWVKKVTEHANDAYRLEDVATGENLAATIYNVKALFKARETKVSEILELLAKQILDATPPYKN